jgi:hypothetical protein
MENKKYQIFVSSTYKDLIEARDKVMETILSLYHFPVGMEMFSADDSEQWEVIKDSIDVSDYYVVIIGHRYGSMTSDGIGYTEKEYDYARGKGIPILAFIRDRNAPTKPDERETSSEANTKLDAFIDKALSNKMCDTWHSIEELTTKVAIALPKTFSRKPQIGWVRGNTAASKEIAEELAKLSQENRELRERVAELEAEMIRDKPIIEVLINSSVNLTLDIPLKFSGMIEEIPVPLNVSDIPEYLTSRVSEADIDNYNQKIPSQELVDKYNKQKRIYWLSQNTTPLKFSVINNGSRKANDINITIKFPKNVLVISVDDIEKIKSPTLSPLPLSPIEKAETAFQKEKEAEERKAKGLLFHSDIFGRSSLDTVIAQPLQFDHLRSLTNFNNTQWIDVKNNIVKIKIQSLLHTRQYNFNDKVVLIPLEEGNSYAEISIICEEFREEETMRLELEIRTD